MNQKLTHTSKGLPEKTRIEITAQLQEWLADTIDLMMLARQAHWIAMDQHCNALHVLFDKIYTDAGKYVDLIAGRIVQFGGIAQGSLHLTAKKSSVQECPQDIVRGKKHVAEQARAIAFYVELMRKAAANSTPLRDADTADILTEVSRGADENLWFVEAHEQSKN